jgi:hypothetical protein
MIQEAYYVNMRGKDIDHWVKIGYGFLPYQVVTVAA